MRSLAFAMAVALGTLWRCTEVKEMVVNANVP
jgi:hypothetical protein